MRRRPAWSRAFTSSLNGRRAVSSQEQGGGLTAQLYAAMAAALLGDRALAIERTHRAEAQVGKSNPMWIFQQVANVAGKNSAQAAPVVKQSRLRSHRGDHQQLGGDPLGRGPNGAGSHDG